MALPGSYYSIFPGAACQTRLTCKRITIKIKLITHFIRLYRVRLTEWLSSTCPNVLRGNREWRKEPSQRIPDSGLYRAELSYYLLPNWLMDGCNLYGGIMAQSLKQALWCVLPIICLGLIEFSSVTRGETFSDFPIFSFCIIFNAFSNYIIF